MQNGLKDREITIGLVQIGAIAWHRKLGQQWHIKNGVPVPKPIPFQPRDFMYLPYSVGLLQGYVQKHAAQPERYNFLPFIYSPLKIEEGVEHLITADIVGFSAYIWNMQQSLSIARRLKEERPEIVIVFGGPQVPDRSEDFLRENPFIDIACHGAGELIFLEILENLYERDNWESIPSTSFIKKDNSYVINEKAARLRDLSVIPSPYLEGVFDDLIDEHPEHDWLVMWESNRGCPFSCTFCDWGSAVASKVFRFEMDRLMAELDWFATRKIPHVFLCDANFGIFPRDIDIARSVVDSFKRVSYPRFLNVQNSKNSTERNYKIQQILNEMSSVGATLSMQSLDVNTLKNIKRNNISLDSFYELSRRYKRDGVKTYTDVLLGLPGESYETFTSGLSRLMRSGQHNNIKFYNTSILPNAEMGDPAYQKHFGLKTVPVPIMHHHDSFEDTQARDVEEYIETVVSTNAMPADDWARARTFVWMLELLHFGRMLQVAFVTLVEQYDLTYAQLIEEFIDVDGDAYPVLGHIRDLFINQAREMQAGKPEYKLSHEWMGVWWPIEHYALIWLVKNKKLKSFYKEVEGLLTDHLQANDVAFDRQVLHDAVVLNENLMTVPFKVSDLKLALSYNIWEYYQGVLSGDKTLLERQETYYYINRVDKIWLTWESWYKDVLPRTDAKEFFYYNIRKVLPDQDNLAQSGQVIASIVSPQIAG